MEWISWLEKLTSKYPLFMYGRGDLISDRQLINSFIDSKPYLKNKRYFLEYLNDISGISYFNEQTEEDFSIYGFDDNATLSYVGGEMPSFVEGGYFLIGHHYFPRKNEVYEFGFSCQDEMDKAIYYHKLTSDREIISTDKKLCHSFKDFMEGIIEFGLDTYLIHLPISN